MASSNRDRILSVRDQPLPGLPGGLRELKQYFRRHGTPRATRRLILQALRKPVRRVGGGRDNVSVRYASRKMGVVIQAESRLVEFAHVYLCEHTPRVIFYLCQPCEMKVGHPYTKKDGSPGTRMFRYRADYLVLDDTGFYLVECKSLKELTEDAAKDHPRYVHEDGKWRWPAAEDAAAELELGFHVFHSEDVNPLWIRGVQFLTDFHDVEPPYPEEVQRVLRHVRANLSVLVDDLIKFADAHPETVWCLVANGKLHTDLENDRIWEVNGARVYDSHERMLAARHLAKAKDSPAWIGPRVVSLEVGSRVSLWDADWKVLHRNEQHLVIQSEEPEQRLLTLPIDDIEPLLRTGALTSETCGLFDEIRREREERFLRASPEALAAAEHRWECVQYFLKHGKPPQGVDERSVRRYVEWMREAERDLGVGFAGLIRRRGRNPQLPDPDDPTERLLAQVVAEFSDPKAIKGTPKAKRVGSCHARLVHLCHEQGIVAVPHLETLRSRLKSQPVARLVAAQRGARAGYQLEGPLQGQGSILPVNGDRVFQKAHIDHVLVDLLLVSSTTGIVIGKPWLTVLIDSFSRMPIGFSLSFDAPSATSVISTIFDCVRRYERLPDEVTADQGSDFHSIRVERGFAKHQVSKSERPARKPRFGAIMERIFGIANTGMFDEMKGNTKILSLNRGLSPSHNPHRHAVWTLPLLHDACEEWLFEIYPESSHGGVGPKPKDVFSSSRARSGERVARFVPYDLALRISLAQDVDRGGERTVSGVRGVVAGYLRYWNPLFQFGDVAGSRVLFRLDPLDASIAFAFVRREWRVCKLLEQDVDLYGRSWKQIKLAVAELRERRRSARRAKNDPITVRMIGEFLCKLDHKGAIAEQIMRDRERLLIQAARPAAAGDSQLHLVSNNPLPARGPLGTSQSLNQAVDSKSAEPLPDIPDDFDDLEPFDVD